MADERVLVVDDEPINRALLRGILGDTYTVLEARDAAQAYDVLARESVDVVLLDVVMPGGESGIDACRKIKASAQDFLPVLLLTGLSEQEDRNAGLQAGADDFLTKPIDRQELRLRVAAFSKLRSQDRQIREQLAALKELNALQNDLAMFLVHDLKNPLTGVFGHLQLLMLDATPVQREDIAAALSATGRMHQTVNDILQICVLETGAMKIVKSDVHLDGIISTALATLSGAARDKNLSLRAASSGIIAHVDGVLLRRAVENLVSNAVSHAPEGSLVEVCVRGDGPMFVIGVADRGRGIPDHRKSTLFTKFGAVDSEAQRMRRGFGLGLYFVQLVAKAHGGGVAVHDHPGGGTLFELSLPLTVSP